MRRFEALILGSCVTRDILNFDEAKTIHMVDYFARSSLASAFHQQAIVDSYTERLNSPFQRRIVGFDLAKTLANKLREYKFDILLLDLIDERFNLFMFEDGGMCTISPELVSAGFDYKTLPGRLIRSGSDEYFDLWERGWCALVDALCATGRLVRLRINRVYWATQTSDGQNFLPSYSQERIETANQFLDRLYERIARDISVSQWLRFHGDLFVGSQSHRWGLSPFHYVDGYYQAALRELFKTSDAL